MWVLKKTTPISRKHARGRQTKILIARSPTDTQIVNEVIFDALEDRFLIRQFERVPDTDK